MNTVVFMSKSNEWETPQYIFDELNREFNFTLDPCATNKNHKCKKYFTIKEDGLNQSWTGEIVFMNPPFGREIKKWIQKAYLESLNKSLVVCLIPAKTDTQYWHDFVMKGDEIRFIKGRLKFGQSKVNAPFPSAIVVFGKKGEI